MIYLGNGIWSDSSPFLSHGGTWKDHKYIAIKNGRYIYPDDYKKQANNYKNVDYVRAKKDELNKKKSFTLKKSDMVNKDGTINGPDFQWYTPDINTVNTGSSQDPVNGGYKLTRGYHDSDKNVDKEFTLQAVKDSNGNKKWGLVSGTKDYTWLWKNFKAAGVDPDTGKVVSMLDLKKKEWNKKSKEAYDDYKKDTETFKDVRAKKSANSKFGSSLTDIASAGANKAKYNVSVTNQGPSAAEKAQRSKVGVISGSSAAKEAQKKGEKANKYISPSEARKRDTFAQYDKKTKDQLGGATKYAKRPDGKDPNPKPGDHQHDIGKAPNPKAPRDNGNLSRTRFYAKNKKFNKAVSSQGPSAAEKAQRGMIKGSSKNVSTGSKTVQYQKKLSDTNKTYQKAVSSQGPSAAEKAQREKGSKKKPQSKNVNSGKPNKKKKNPFKELAKWIKGNPGKVSVH